MKVCQLKLNLKYSSPELSTINPIIHSSKWKQNEFSQTYFVSELLSSIIFLHVIHDFVLYSIFLKQIA